jgi:hypothetical protein
MENLLSTSNMVSSTQLIVGLCTSHSLPQLSLLQELVMMYGLETPEVTSIAMITKDQSRIMTSGTMILKPWENLILLRK